METTTLETTGTTVELTKTEKDVLNYLNKTAKHLFVTEDNYFFKVIPVEVGNEWYYITMKFNGEKTVTQITKISDKIDYYEKCSWLNHKETKRYIKLDLFPQHYDKKIAIKNFKIMRGLMEEVVNISKKIISNEDEMKEKISKLLSGIKVKQD